MPVETAPELRARKREYWPSIAGFLATLLVVALISIFPFAVRLFLFQPFNTPSGSMAPTLIVGDYFFVSKYDYGFGFFTSEPQAGDVVVFRLPRDGSTQYVKRIVGLPGDRVQMVNGVLNINNRPVKQEQLAPFFDEERRTAIKRWRETLPNGVSYETLDEYGNGLLDNTAVYQVPRNHMFVLGDNRDNSIDSRVPVTQSGGIGFVPLENITGHARIIYFSLTPKGAHEPTIRFGRIGTLIR